MRGEGEKSGTVRVRDIRIMGVMGVMKFWPARGGWDVDDRADLRPGEAGTLCVAGGIGHSRKEDTGRMKPNPCSSASVDCAFSAKSIVRCGPRALPRALPSATKAEPFRLSARPYPQPPDARAAAAGKVQTHYGVSERADSLVFAWLQGQRFVVH